MVLFVVFSQKAKTVKLNTLTFACRDLAHPTFIIWFVVLRARLMVTEMKMGTPCNSVCMYMWVCPATCSVAETCQNAPGGGSQFTRTNTGVAMSNKNANDVWSRVGAQAVASCSHVCSKCQMRDATADKCEMQPLHT